MIAHEANVFNHAVSDTELTVIFRGAYSGTRLCVRFPFAIVTGTKLTGLIPFFCPK